MANKVIKSSIITFGLFCFVTASMAAKDQKVPEWKDETNVPEPSRYESFEDGMPEHWELIGEGSVTTNPWHYKLGKQSLQWDYKAGDVIKINNTLGNTQWRGGVNNACFAHFGVWIYNKEPMPGKAVRFEFREGEKDGAYFDFTLNFKGWECAFPMFGSKTAAYADFPQKTFSRPVTDKVDNILIHAPEDAEGRVFIDCLVYNGPMYYLMNFIPDEEPWQAPAFDDTEYPAPEKISDRDMEALKRVENALASPNIVETATESGIARYEEAMEKINHLEIVEDEHGIRGRPINMPRWHGRGDGEFFIENNVPEEEIEHFKGAFVRGGALSAIRNAMTVGLTLEQYDNLAEQSALLWKYILDQCAGNGHYYAGTYVECIVPAYQVSDALFEHGIMDEVRNYLQYRRMPFFSQRTPIVNMDYFSAIRTLLYGAFLMSEKPEKQLQAFRFYSNRFNTEIMGDYGSSGFKPDGVGEHNVGFAVDYMKGGIRGIAEIAYLFSDSSFALSDEAYETLKRVAWRAYFYSSSFDLPLTMQGTGVFRIQSENLLSRSFWALPVILRHLALAGEDGCDPDLAQAYVNLKPVIQKHPFLTSRSHLDYDPVFEEKYGIKPSNPPEGNISMPYGALVAHRRADWLAIAHSGSDMRDRGNHYGYFLRNGPLTIMVKDGLASSGTVKEGWDWSRIDGATAPYIPELTSIKYIHSGRKMPPENAEGHEKAAQWLEQFRQTDAARTGRHIGNGGISWRGINGCHRIIFANDGLLNPYRVIKSYFFIDDRIYAIGSDITSYSKEYSMQTTLYQKALPEPDTPTWINGEEVTEFPSTNHLPLTVNHSTYLIDSVGNGYYVPAGQNLYTARTEQESRLSKFNEHEDSVGKFATAWLDHGVECEDAKYAYVIMPYCDREKFMTFGEDDYEILQQDGNAHILYDKIDGFYAGIFFQGGAVKNLPYVKEVERACQIMYREKNGSLEIAFGDPNPHRWPVESTELRSSGYGGPSVLTPLQVMFDGAWELAEPVDGVEIISTDNDATVIEFACIHGKTFDFTLVVKRPWWRRLFSGRY